MIIDWDKQLVLRATCVIDWFSITIGRILQIRTPSSEEIRSYIYTPGFFSGNPQNMLKPTIYSNIASINTTFHIKSVNRLKFWRGTFKDLLSNCKQFLNKNTGTVFGLYLFISTFSKNMWYCNTKLPLTTYCYSPSIFNMIGTYISISVYLN